MERIEQRASFGGWQEVWKHSSSSLQCDMKLAVYLPPAALKGEKCPVLYWLSGLTCTEQNFITKAGAQQYAAQHGFIVVAPPVAPGVAPVSRLLLQPPSARAKLAVTATSPRSLRFMVFSFSRRPRRITGGTGSALLLRRKTIEGPWASQGLLCTCSRRVVGPLSTGRTSREGNPFESIDQSALQPQRQPLVVPRRHRERHQPLLDAGQVDAAAKEIAEAVRLNGPSAWSHVALARVAELRGDGGERGRQAALAREALRGADVAEVPRL